MIKLEVGKFYRDGYKRKIKIVYKKDGRFIGFCPDDTPLELAYVYRENGRMIDACEPVYDDIIGEWQEQEPEQEISINPDTCINNKQNEFNIAIIKQIDELRDRMAELEHKLSALFNGLDNKIDAYNNLNNCALSGLHKRIKHLEEGGIRSMPIESTNKRMVDVESILEYLTEMARHAHKRSKESSGVDSAYYTGELIAYNNARSLLKKRCEVEEV